MQAENVSKILAEKDAEIHELKRKLTEAGESIIDQAHEVCLF